MSTKENLTQKAQSAGALPPAETEQPGETASSTETTETGQATAETTAPAGVALTPQQIEELKARAGKAEEHWDRLLRTMADLENFKKRAARERLEATRFANASLLEKLIPALDNLDMALAAANSAETNSVKSLKTGILMIYNQLKSARKSTPPTGRSTRTCTKRFRRRNRPRPRRARSFDSCAKVTSCTTD